MYGLLAGPTIATAQSRDEVLATMKRAATYYHTRVAVHGGYVYYTSSDLQQRFGEGVASPEQIWVQPPGTPTVGLAYLAAWRATGDKFYLDAAIDAARALVHGQLRSGGWTNAVDFNPRGSHSADYRNGQGRGKNNSTLDDGITQSALVLLFRVDQALDFRDSAIHDAAKVGLDALLAAQYANGAFPQVWTGPVPARPVLKAKFPDYAWRTENRIKEYWNEYTLNDDLASYVADTLIVAHEVYRDARALAALRTLGDFLVLAQLPEPQPGWAQQYDTEMRPIWARKFEPPAVAGRETQTALETLLKIHRHTHDAKFLEPFPRALAYFKRSRLADGRLSRYYELQTNRPLYMTERYELTYDDTNLPVHYGWKTESRIESIERDFAGAKLGKELSTVKEPLTAAQVTEIIKSLDTEGRWLSTYDGSMIVGQPKFKPGQPYIASAVFSRNLTLLSDYLGAPKIVNHD
ncbi:MAG: pectic acid lyase [Planctomycetaceae bacterium]|nr:pectic acid lyase [Planctomycetaceae bacterium]